MTDSTKKITLLCAGAAVPNLARDDAMTRLEATLDDIVGKLRENGFANEQSVSQGVVLPVLRDLNWPDHETDVVWPEYQTGEGRVDFALCHPPRKPRIFIEVKQPGGARRGVKQAFEYAFHTGVPFIVLTDGATWSFYLPAEQGSYEERRVCVLNLLEHPTKDSAGALYKYLEWGRVVSDEALLIAREEYRCRSRRAAARMEIPNTWNGLIDKHDSSLIDLLADAVKANVGIRPEDTDVVDFLGSLRQRMPVIAPSPPSPEPAGEKRRAWWAERIVFALAQGSRAGLTLTVRTAARWVERIICALAQRTRAKPTPKVGTAAWWPGRIIRSTRAENPRRPDSKGWHSHNFIMSHPDGVTYEDYRAAGYTLNHLQWDLEYGYITAEHKAGWTAVLRRLQQIVCR